MPSYKFPPNSAARGKIDGVERPLIKKTAVESFNPSVLGIGDIKKQAVSKTAVVAIFDLEGFTRFCGQSEPDINVPLFLSEFLNWLFESIRVETICKECPEGVTLWHNLPFFTKFMGDGIMILWSTEGVEPLTQHNLITSCLEILRKYKAEFHPKIRRKVGYAPPSLRCGVAKGTVLSIGAGEDYVGSCINLAARLQKLPGAGMAFSRTGFNPEDEWSNSKNLEGWLLKKVAVRGIGEGELVYIRKLTFDKMSQADKANYLEP